MRKAKKNTDSHSDELLIREVPRFPYGQCGNTICRHLLSILIARFHEELKTVEARQQRAHYYFSLEPNTHIKESKNAIHWNKTKRKNF